MTDTITIVAGILTNSENEILMGLRPLGGTRPNLWEYPGGKVERSDDNHRAALCREFIEELLVEITVDVYPIFSCELELENNYQFHLYPVQLNGEQQITKRVHAMLLWANLENSILNMSLGPVCYMAYPAVKSYLKRLV